MIRKYMQEIKLVFGLFFAIGMFALIWDKFGYKPVPFRPTEITVADNLVGKAVTLPQGQLWGFNNDQNIKVKIISQKMTNDLVVIIVDVRAMVIFPPLDPKTSSAKEKQAKQATLNGLIRVYYEQVDNIWYLINVEGIDLKVIAE